MRCPNCGFVQMPEPRCKRCGMALHAPLPAEPPAAEILLRDVHEKPRWYRGAWMALAREVFLHVPPAVNPIALCGRAALYVVFLVWGWRFITMDYATVVDGYPPINQSFMHAINLVFHEAGHVLFIPLGRFMTILGGTLGQWLIPFIVLCALLLKTRDTFGASIGLWWLGQSFLDIAPYIHDARAGQLVLLGGVTGRDAPGYHDWENILRDLGWMAYDHTIAGIVYAIGVAFMLLAFAWGATVLSLQYKNLDRRP